MRDHDDDLVARLRAGDEPAFVELVERYSPSLLAVARTHVASHEVAEDVVQDTWLALLKGIDAFEGRSSLRTWLFRVLVNTAKTRGVRDRRSRPVELTSVQPWHVSPERALLSGEAVRLVRRALAGLPEQQRIVVALRDVDGRDSGEVCALLGLTPANQRVLLHRGRVRVREALVGYYGATTRQPVRAEASAAAANTAGASTEVISS